MANVDAPFGLRPVRYRSGAKWNGKTTLYAISIGATNPVTAAPGDHVVSTGASDSEGLLIVKTAAETGGETGAIRGVIDSIYPGNPGHKISSFAAPTTKSPQSLTTPGKGYVNVIDDPDVVFQIQVDSGGDQTAVVGQGVSVASIGLNAAMVRTGMQTTIHKSGLQLHSSSISNNFTAGTFKIVGYPHDLGGMNVVASPFATVEVIINNHELGQGSGSAGI